MERALAVILVVGCAGYVHGVVLKGACNTTVTCDNSLFCQYETCRAKIGTNCNTANAINECVGNLTCPAANTPCACSDPSIPNGEKTACVSKVGGNCTNESDCLKNGMCGSDKMCACNVNFTKSIDNSICLSKVGGSCTNQNDCLTNGTCTNTKCDCFTNYTRSYDMSSCGLVVDQNCPLTSACGENSICTALKCVCNSGLVSNSGRCAKTVNANCTLNAECSLWAECSGTTTKTCTCKASYVIDDAKQFCKAAPVGGAKAVYGSLLTLLTLFVTARML